MKQSYFLNTTLLNIKIVVELFKEECQIVREGADPHMISKFERH